MPAINDLTPEEEALFAQHGVPSSGQGGEPISQGQEEIVETPEQQGVEQGVDQGGQIQQTDQQGEPAPGEVGSRRRADGTFKNAAELEADRVALEQAQTSQGQGGQQAQGQQQQSPQMVPLAALHEARQRSAQLTQQLQTAIARMNALVASNQGLSQEEEMPDITTDPAGFVMALDQRLRAFEEARREEQQYRQIDNALEQDEILFSQTQSDYEQASDYYIQSRARELAAFHQPQDIQRILVAEARSIAQNAWQRGMSPAQMVYGLAQARGYAFAPQQQSSVTPPIQQQNQPRSNGPTPQDIVSSITNGQRASRSLSGGAGTASTGQLNAEALLQMSDEEFEAHLQLGKKGADARFAAIG